MHDKLVDSNPVESRKWIATAHFSGMSYHNDGQYLPKAEAREVSLVKNLWKNNVEFSETCFSNGPSDLLSHRFLAIHTFCIFDVGEKL